MRLPSFRRLVTTDYPKEFQKLIDILSVSLNNGIEVLYQALSQNISIRDNIQCTVKDVVLTVDANGKPIQQASFALTALGKVEGVSVILAQNQTNSAIYPSSGVFVSGVQSNTSFLINNVTGLQAGQSYLIRCIAWQS